WELCKSTVDRDLKEVGVPAGTPEHRPNPKVVVVTGHECGLTEIDFDLLDRLRIAGAEVAGLFERLVPQRIRPGAGLTAQAEAGPPSHRRSPTGTGGR